MRRRDFITVLGGVAVSQPLAARAQRPNMPVIRYLDTGPPERISSALSDLRRRLNDDCVPPGNGRIQRVERILTREFL
jgi:hypothetical protein